MAHDKQNAKLFPHAVAVARKLKGNVRMMRTELVLKSLSRCTEHAHNNNLAWTFMHTIEKKKKKQSSTPCKIRFVFLSLHIAFPTFLFIFIRVRVSLLASHSLAVWVRARVSLHMPWNWVVYRRWWLQEELFVYFSLPIAWSLACVPYTVRISYNLQNPEKRNGMESIFVRFLCVRPLINSTTH